MALNLQRHGVMSLDESPPYQPSSFREPVPVAAIAATVAVTDAWFGKAEPKEYFSGARARYLKLVNLLWLVVLATSAFLAIRYLSTHRTSSPRFSNASQRCEPRKPAPPDTSIRFTLFSNAYPKSLRCAASPPALQNGAQQPVKAARQGDGYRKGENPRHE
jgi:hypothetical protein